MAACKSSATAICSACEMQVRIPFRSTAAMLCSGTDALRVMDTSVGTNCAAWHCTERSAPSATDLRSACSAGQSIPARRVNAASFNRYFEFVLSSQCPSSGMDFGPSACNASLARSFCFLHSAKSWSAGTCLEKRGANPAYKCFESRFPL